MMPTAFMTGAVAMLADSGAQLLYFGEELVAGELFEVFFVHNQNGHRKLRNVRIRDDNAVLCR